MSEVHNLFRAGKLTEAIAEVTQMVKSQPSDVVARGLLSELLCFTGDLDRADKQLDAASQISPSAAVGVGLLRHLIRSEICRREVHSDGRVPEFIEPPTESQQLRLRAVMAAREKKFSEAAELIQQASALEPDVAFEVNGLSVSGFRDLDDFLGPNFEVYTATGKYYWIGVEQLRTLEFSEPECLTDQLWRAAEIQTTADLPGRVHVPVLYRDSHLAEDPRVRIGKATDWQSSEGESVVFGYGQREFLAGDDVIPIMQISTLRRIDQPIV